MAYEREKYIAWERAAGRSWSEIAMALGLSERYCASLLRAWDRAGRPTEAPTLPPRSREDAPATELRDHAAIVRDILLQHPEAWLGVPRTAPVALPWEGTSGSALRAFRPAAGAASALRLNTSGRTGLYAARVNSIRGGLVVEIVMMSELGAYVERTIDGWGRATPGPVDLPAAQAAADAALVAAGWVTL